MEELFHLIYVIFGQHVLPKSKGMMMKMFGGMNAGTQLKIMTPVTL